MVEKVLLDHLAGIKIKQIKPHSGTTQPYLIVIDLIISRQKRKSRVTGERFFRVIRISGENFGLPGLFIELQQSFTPDVTIEKIRILFVCPDRPDFGLRTRWITVYDSQGVPVVFDHHPFRHCPDNVFVPRLKIKILEMDRKPLRLLRIVEKVIDNSACFWVNSSNARGYFVDPDIAVRPQSKRSGNIDKSFFRVLAAKDTLKLATTRIYLLQKTMFIDHQPENPGSILNNRMNNFGAQTAFISFLSIVRIIGDGIITLVQNRQAINGGYPDQLWRVGKIGQSVNEIISDLVRFCRTGQVMRKRFPSGVETVQTALSCADPDNALIIFYRGLNIFPMQCIWVISICGISFEHHSRSWIEPVQTASCTNPERAISGGQH
ncbi:MAG: hypothetical protein ACD_39C01931G0002 [uncultured bacterium]|nr:MAG: hypothetical protein ACD_39C01931G0002 [uncultured bacterium]